MIAKNILLITHRRSGTHLTIDTIRNNFSEYFLPYISINELFKKSDIELERFSRRIKQSPRIYKSHSDINYYAFHRNKKSLIDFYENLLNNSKLIYISRDVKDTLTSLYFHYLKYYPEFSKTSIDDFIFSQNDYHTESYQGELNRIHYWKYHYEGWANSSFSKNILFLTFEELISNYFETINRISDFINCKLKSEIVDIRISDKGKEIKRTNKPITTDLCFTVESFRNGKIGDHINHFSNESINEINNILYTTVK